MKKFVDFGILSAAKIRAGVVHVCWVGICWLGNWSVCLVWVQSCTVVVIATDCCNTIMIKTQIKCPLVCLFNKALFFSYSN